MLENIIYLLIICSGFIIPFIMCYKFNKRDKILSLEYFLYSYIIFIIFFFIFAKMLYIILDNKWNMMSYIMTNDIVMRFKFILSGYTFVGGYIGGLVSLILMSKLFKRKILKLMYIYIPNMLLMYGILKLGCYVKGCCGSYVEIPIQLIEAIINLMGYMFILWLVKVGSKNIVAMSFILFGLFRFILSLFREFSYLYILVFMEIFCLIMISYGIYLKKNNIS